MHSHSHGGHSHGAGEAIGHAHIGHVHGGRTKAASPRQGQGQGQAGWVLSTSTGPTLKLLLLLHSTV